MTIHSGKVAFAAVRTLACGALLVVAGSAAANYNDECRTLAQRLATDPGALKVGELDLLKSCLSDLQRSQVLGEPPPAKSVLPACEPQPVPECAAPAAATPAAPAATRAKPAAPPRERPREEDRRLKPYLPKY